MFFDNNFLFFVTVDDSGGLQSKFWKKTTYAFLPYGLIAFDTLQDIKNNFLMNFFTNFLFIVTMVAMFDGEWGPQPQFWKNITYVSNLIAIYSKGFFWIF